VTPARVAEHPLTAIDVPPGGGPAGRPPDEHPNRELHRPMIVRFSRLAICHRVVVKHTGASHDRNCHAGQKVQYHVGSD